jgi:hypothetical protein
VASDIQKVCIILLLIFVFYLFCLTVKDMKKTVKPIIKANEYTHTELAPVALLYVLYDERRIVHECNDGRISKIYKEGRKGIEGDGGSGGESGA